MGRFLNLFYDDLWLPDVIVTSKLTKIEINYRKIRVKGRKYK